MIKCIKCNAWDYTLISHITTYYNHIHATVMICFVTINKRKWAFLGLFTGKKWHSTQLKFASPYVACDLSVWEGKLNQALYCACGVAYGIKQCSVMIFNVGCDLRAQKLGTQIRNFKSAMFACNVCVLELVHIIIRCIVGRSVYDVSQLFWCREVTHNNTVVAALRCEAIYASQYFITSQRVTRLSFTRYNLANFLCFFFIYGVVKKPRYNRNLAISELVVNGCSFHWTTHKRKRDRELCLVKTGTLVVSELVIYNGVSLYTFWRLKPTRTSLASD